MHAARRFDGERASDHRVRPTPERRNTDAAYTSERKRRIGSSESSIPSVTRVGSKTSTSSPCSRSCASPVTSRRPRRHPDTVVGPDRGWITGRVAILGDPHRQDEGGLPESEPVRQVSLEVVGAARNGLRFGEDGLARFGLEAIPHVAAGAVRVDEPERVQRVVGTAQVTLGRRRRQHRRGRGERLGVFAEKPSDRIGIGLARLRIRPARLG